MSGSIEVVASGVEMLPDYARVPMYVRVTSRLRLDHGEGLTGLRLVEVPVEPPYTKTYEDPKDPPTGWALRWDVSTWGFFAATRGGRVVGGAVVAQGTHGMDMPESRDDVAVLWDIRVHPGLQRAGVGSRLFAQAVRFARERRCRYLKIETQNVNVPACRFYRKQGCHLGGILEHAYREYPAEVELLWYLELSPRGTETDPVS